MTNIYIWYFCQVRTENVWWRNQGILGVGNRHDNTYVILTIVGDWGNQECALLSSRTDCFWLLCVDHTSPQMIK